MEENYYLIKMLEVKYNLTKDPEVKEMINFIIDKQIENNVLAKSFLSERKVKVQEIIKNVNDEDDDIPF